jgi:dual oxidase
LFSIYFQRFGEKLEISEHSQSLHHALSSTVTKEKRLAKLEKFFKVVFGQAFAIDQPKGEADLIDPELIREVIHTELTRAEFASALGMKSESQFVVKVRIIIVLSLSEN